MMKEKDENVLVVCEECKSYPCKWTSVGNELLPSIDEFIEEQGRQDIVTNASIQFYYYHEITSRLYGYLGPKNRRRLPKCCVMGVRALFPATDDAGYVGFKKNHKST